jgi:transitional endoplasmic reticulum ATPase
VNPSSIKTQNPSSDPNEKTSTSDLTNSPNLISNLSMDSKALHNVYGDYSRSGNGETSRSKHIYYTALKKHYPNHFVVGVDPENAEFLDFASAGFAEAKLDTTGDHFDAARIYIPVKGGRQNADSATLSTEVLFGRYQYSWEGKAYLIYKTSWQNYWGSDIFWNFVLYEKPAPAPEFTDETTSCPEIDELLLALGRFSSVPHKDIYVFDGGYYYRSKSTWDSIKAANWDDVVMDPAIKARIMKDTISFFTPATQELFKKYKLPYKRGLLMYGAPGNGKTITIKALIAHMMRLPEAVPTFYVKSTTDKCNGDQKSIQKIFKQARKLAPCILVFEDLDSMVTNETRSYFLNEVDGMESNDGILMIASTNHIDKIDDSIRSRPSRFDRKYGFDLPEHKDRVRYAEHWRKKLADNKDIEFTQELVEAAANLTPDYSYAYLQEVFISSLMVIARKAAGEDEEWDFIRPESAAQSDNGNETPKNAEKEAVEEKKLESEEKQPTRRQVPKIDISESLASNDFFKIFHQQVKILTKEMDTIEQEEKVKKEKEEKEGKISKEEKSKSCTSCSK